MQHHVPFVHTCVNCGAGIHVRCLTLDANFHAPLIREYCLACGLRSAGRSSIKNILARCVG